MTDLRIKIDELAKRYDIKRNTTPSWFLQRPPIVEAIGNRSLVFCWPNNLQPKEPKTMYSLKSHRYSLVGLIPPISIFTFAF